MKTIKVYRGGSKSPKKLPNGDLYDSALEVLDQKGNALFRSELVNTDPTTGFKGGILSAGNYYFIIGMHKGKYAAPILFKLVDDKRFERIKQKNDLTIGERTFPSKIPNPVQKDKKIMTCVNIHKGGNSSDFSNGCITIYKEEWKSFISHFEIGEKGKVEVIEVKK